MPTPVTLAYLAVCAVVGLLGRNHKFGFWGMTFGSIVLSPVVGLLILIGSQRKPKPFVCTCPCPNCRNA